jgi:hypothetical protein
MKNLKSLNKKLSRTELCEIGKKHKTDKQWHGYTKVYYEIMKELKDENINFLEIGIYFGASLRMWHEFFKKGKIYGIDNGRMLPKSGMIPGGRDGTQIDILSVDDVKLLQPEAVVDYNNFSWINNDKIKCFIADQRSKKQLENALKYFNCNKFDFILDDGQHFQEHQQKSLALLLKNIKSKGYYIIEDVVDHKGLLAGSYWGQRKKDVSDSTDLVFKSYIKTGKLNSIYLTKEECEYIENNVEDVFMYDCENRNNSPISGSSKLLIIKKK